MTHAERTRAHETVSPHDPHRPLDFTAILTADAERAAWAEAVADGTRLATQADLAGHAETVTDSVLERIQTAQKQAFLAVAREHPLLSGQTLNNREVIDFVNNLQIGSASEQAAYLQIINESHQKAAEQLTAAGYNSYSIGTAITRAVESAGGNLSGAATDIQTMSVTQQLTIVGAAGLGFILPRTHNVHWAAGAGTVALILQSPHAAALATSVGGGVLRASTQIVAAPLRIGMRSTEVINGLLSPDLAQTLQNQVMGTGVDLRNSFGYILDGDFSPENNPEANPALMEFLSLGREYAPPELSPLLDYLTQLRAGNVTRLPTRVELETAGNYLARVEGLVTEDTYLTIEQKRISGQPLSTEEKQQYVIYKYALLVNAAFRGENALQPQATVVQASYEATDREFNTLTEALASLSPQQQAALAAHQFSWTPAQVQQFQNQTEQLGLAVNFENLTKHGAVGLALNLYLALTVLGVTIGGLKATYRNRTEQREATQRNREIPDIERTLSGSELGNVKTALSDRTNTVGTVVRALVAAKVLSAETNFDRSVRNLKLEQLDAASYDALVTLANADTTQRGALRNAFFTLLESSSLFDPDQLENQNARRDFYVYADILNRLDLFYRYVPRGTSKALNFGGQTFTIGRPERGQFRFTTTEQLQQIANPRNFYRWMTNTGEDRTLRMQNPQGETIYMRIRREGDQYQFNSRERGGSWQNFDLVQLQQSLTGTADATPSA